MFIDKLSRLKKFLSTSTTSIIKHRPEGANDEQLPNKLKYYIEHILRQEDKEDNEQFRAYQELQEEIGLNRMLEKIWRSKGIKSENVVAIISFYTFLLVNCTSELVVCKLVSERFVMELTKIRLERKNRIEIINGKKNCEKNEDQEEPETNLVLQTSEDNHSSITAAENHHPELTTDSNEQYIWEHLNEDELDEINAYKTALIKAYTSRINSETIKYMILDDSVPLLANCVQAYCDYMLLVMDKDVWGVETTCIGNSILVVLNSIKHDEWICSLVYKEEGKDNEGVNCEPKHLIGVGLTMLIRKMMTIAEEDHINEELQSNLESSILFLIDVLQAISSGVYLKRILSQSELLLKEIVRIAEKCIDRLVGSVNSFSNCAEMLNLIFRLLIVYGQEEAFVRVIEFKAGEIVDRLLENCRLVEPTLSEKLKMLCSGMKMIAKILKSSYCKLSDRSQTTIESYSLLLLSKLNSILELLLDNTKLFENICLKSVQLLLLSLLQLAMASRSEAEHGYNVLQLFLKSIERLRVVLRDNRNWDYVVMHYESLMKEICNKLLEVEQEHNCPWHKSSFYHSYSENSSNEVDHPIIQPEELQNTILLYEYIRNFRFMMVCQTNIDNNFIKLEKIYHKNFVTVGWRYEPGMEFDIAGKIVCELLLHDNNCEVPMYNM